jgi:hypothetical protein
MTEVFQINGELDLEALTKEFARNHRVSIKHFLARGADRLYERIVSRKDWSLTMNANGKHYEFDHEAQRSMSSMQMKVLELQALVD